MLFRCFAPSYYSVYLKNKDVSWTNSDPRVFSKISFSPYIFQASSSNWISLLSFSSSLLFPSVRAILLHLAVTKCQTMKYAVWEGLNFSTLEYSLYQPFPSYLPLFPSSLTFQLQLLFSEQKDEHWNDKNPFVSSMFFFYIYISFCLILF